MRCRDCKYFNKEHDDINLFPSFGECDSPIFHKPIRYHEREGKNPNMLFLLRSCDEDGETHLVHQDFGCVGFEKKK